MNGDRRVAVSAGYVHDHQASLAPPEPRGRNADPVDTVMADTT